jgi:hypothetical protein
MLGRVKISFFKVYEQGMAFLAGSRFAHNLAAFEGLLLASRCTGLTVRLKVIDGKQILMVHMRVERQQPCRTLLDDPPPRVATSMYPPFVPFRTLAPTLHIHIVFREISRLATDKQPSLNTAHHVGKLLVNGIASTAMLRAPFLGSQVALPRVPDVLQRLAHAETRRVPRTTRSVVA